MNIYEQEKQNRQKTVMLMVGFTLFLAFLGAGLDFFLINAGFGPGFPVATLGAVAVGGFMSYWSLHGGDQAILESSRARPIDPSDPRQKVLDNVAEEMSIAAGLPKPKLYVIPDPDPNAFATGPDPAHASIAVTEGCLSLLNREELQGVLSHEMSHVRNYDTRMMTVVAALVGAVLLLADWGRRGMWWGGIGSRRSRDENRGSGGPAALVFLALWIVSIILAPLIANVVALAVSRQREYLADASGAELTRNPLALASALQKIASATGPTRSIKQGVAHLCIEDPRGRALNASEGAFANLFSTHPPIAKRIELLRQMAYQAGARG
jgi:heat shock protein HtpX